MTKYRTLTPAPMGLNWMGLEPVDGIKPPVEPTPEQWAEIKAHEPDRWKRMLVDKIDSLERQLGQRTPPDDDDDEYPHLARAARTARTPELTPDDRARLQIELAAALLEYEPILRAEERRRNHKRLSKAGWEERVLDTLAAPDFKPAGPYYDALRALNERDGGIIVLAGNPGSGKTTAAAARASEWSCDAHFLRAAEFFRSSRYDDKRDKILSQWALVLDDLGAEYADKGGNYAVDFDELVDRFYANKHTLVITTNIPWPTPASRAEAKAKGIKVDEAQPTFVERYGERVMDRIRHCGKWVSSPAPSMRKRGD